MSCSIKNRPEVLYKQAKVALDSYANKVLSYIHDITPLTFCLKLCHKKWQKASLQTAAIRHLGTESCSKLLAVSIYRFNRFIIEGKESIWVEKILIKLKLMAVWCLWPEGYEAMLQRQCPHKIPSSGPLDWVAEWGAIGLQETMAPSDL